jgi:predicted neuraminidase
MKNQLLLCYFYFATTLERKRDITLRSSAKAKLAQSQAVSMHFSKKLYAF